MIRIGRHTVIPSDLMGVRVVAPKTAAAPWWYVAGVTCVAAYQPKGAASLAASYVNLAQPGTYNAAPGSAPTFNAATGWTFDGATQYLTTGVVPAVAQTWTFIIRYLGCAGNAANQVLFGAGNSDTAGICINPMRWGICYTYGWASTKGAATAAGVVAIGGQECYLNGASIGTLGVSSSGGTALYIGAQNNAGSAINFRANSTQAFAVYSGTLTAPQVAALSAAMAAL